MADRSDQHPADENDPVQADDPGLEEPKVYAQTPWQRPPGTCEVVLVRHGASQSFVPGQPFPLVDGHGDPPLSEAGHAQAELVGHRLVREVPEPAGVYVSTLCRTSQTAEPYLRLLGATVTAAVEADLREVLLGEWEGGEFRVKVAEGHPIALRMFAEQRWDVIPGAEAADALEARVRGVLARITERHAEDPNPVVCFSHGALIAEIARLATGAAPFTFLQMENTSISRFVVGLDGSLRLRSLNDTGHLA